MKNRVFYTAALVFFLFSVLFSLRADDLIRRLSSLSNNGNWAELRKAAAEALDKMEPDDVRAGKVWAKLREGILRGNEISTYDAQFEKYIGEKFHENLYCFVIDHLDCVPDSGVMISGEFRRGPNRGNAGRYVTTGERDRVRIIQLMSALIPKALEEKDTDLRGLFFYRLSLLLISGRRSGNSYKLQALTDFSRLPEYGESEGATSSISRPPVNADGSPVLYHVPASWDAAGSDGERYRYALDTAIRAGSEKARKDWADFLCGQFDFLTAGHSFRREYYQSPAMRDFLYNLGEDETIADLADGIRRIRLPEEFQYIRMYKELKAYESLGEIYLSRMQFERAAEAFKKTRSNRDLYKQILGDYGAPQNLHVQPAGMTLKVPFHYRNAKKVHAALYRVRTEDAADLMLKNWADAQADWQSRSLLNLPSVRVDKKDWDKVIEKKPEKEIVFSLDPLPHHWESETYLDFGKMEPGAFIIRVTPLDANDDKALYSQADMLVWISDSILSVRQRSGKQTDLFLNQTDTGAPIPDAELKIYSFYMKRGWSRKSSIIRTEQISKRTDADGMAVVSSSDFDMPPDSYVAARFVFAENTPGKRTFLSGLNFPSDRSQTFPRRRRTFFISDRPIYKPGDAVAVTGYVRTPSYGDKVDALSLGTVDLMVVDPRGKKAFELTVPYDKETQSFTMETKLAADALPGLWRMRIKDLPGTLSFRVEEYKKPEYKLEVTPPAEPVPSGEQIPVAVSMNYYFGAPVAGAKVTYKVFREETVRTYPFVFVWNWLYGRYYAICSTAYENRYVRSTNIGRTMILDAKGVTDSEGKLSFRIDTSADIAKFGEKNFRYTVEAEASDDSGRIVKGSGAVIAAVKPFTVSIYTPWGFAQTGKVCHIRIAARTPDGKKVAGKGVLRIFRPALNAQGVPERIGEALKSFDFIPDGEDVVYVPGEPGVYELDAEVVSEKGIRISESIPIHVVGEKLNEGLFGELPLTVATDKPEYKPGDTAKILVTCNRPDRTVYFLERAERENKIRRETLKGYSGLFEIPIEKVDQPNFFVEVMCVSEGEMHTVRKQIVIPPEKKVLNLSAVPETARVKPGVSVPMTLSLTGLDGKPVSGAVTVAVYDKSLEALSASSIPAIVPFFWNWKRYCSSSWNSNLNASCGVYFPREYMERGLESRFSIPFTGGYEYGMRRRYLEYDLCCEDGAAAGGAAPVVKAMAPVSMSMMRSNSADRSESQSLKMKSAGADHVAESGGSDESAEAPTDVLRTNFLDRAFWIGRTVLPESGKTKVNIPVPDNLTSWTIRAWAITRDARAGEASTEIVVSKDLIARLELPRFMVRGDTVSAVAIVHNLTEKEAETEVVLTAPGLLESPVRRKLTIAAGGKASFDVPLTADCEPGECVLTLSARSGSESDALELKLPVLVKGIDKQLNNCGRLDPQKTKDVIRLTIPEARKPGSSAFALHISPGAARNMVELLPYLASDDSDDVFSLVNRFLPALAAKKALARLGVDWSQAVPGKKTNRDPLYAEYMNRYGGKAAVPSFKAEDFDRIVSNSIRKVRKMVNSDGGWGWFGTHGEHSWADTTSYVVDSLLDLRETSLHEPGDDALIDRGLDWLTKWADERILEIQRHGEHVFNIDCLVVRTLARGGRPHKKLMDLCYKHRVRDLSPWGYAMLALAYDKDSDECTMLIRNLEQFLKKDEENGTAWLNIPSSCCFFWYGNESETLSAYLLLLLRNDPASRTATMIARYLTVNILNSPWRNSLRGIGAAVRALAEYTVVSGEGDPDFTLTMRIGKSVHTVSIDKKNMWENAGPVLFLPDSALKSGPLNVELEFSGRGAVYWNSMLNYFSLEDTFEPAGLEMRIRRKYYRLVQDEDASALLAGRGGSVRKERVLRYHKVPLKEGDVVNPGDLLEVELISTAKNDYDYVVFEDAMPAGFEYENPVSGWMRTGFGAPIYAAYRERGARFYLRNMARGDSNVFYRIRAQLKGRVTALPAKGYGIYAPELKCNGAGMNLRTE